MIFALIVTYGNRFNFLQQVIDSCIEEKVNKILVVDNDSEQESKEKLQELESKLSDRVDVVYLDKNIGSAGGFKIGLERILTNNDCDFVWLLDDDNVPERKSLQVIKDYWSSLSKKDKNVALLSYRPVKDNIGYRNAILENKPDLVLGRKNSFLGFHYRDLPKKIIKQILLRTIKRKPIVHLRSGAVAVAPYGGIFISKDLIKKIGFPDEQFFVYGDDHEWSYRITKQGGRIILLLDSRIHDCDVSWNVKKETKTNFESLVNAPTLRLFYSTRNRIFFEKNNLIDNVLIYWINLILYVFIFLGYAFCFFNITNVIVFFKAIKDGYFNTRMINNRY